MKIFKTAYIESNSFDPWLNLAIEEYLLNNYAAEHITLYLWQNAHTVVIGQNQNAWRECRLEVLEKDRGKLARRLSGGGAVYHDLGNLNFTFLLPKREYNLHKQLAVIVDAVKELGIQANFSGRNDILAQGKKFSGNAFYHGRRASYHHGTVLVNVDMKKLSKYLNVSTAKIQSKGIKSVASRVVNLSELKPDLTVSDMKKAMYLGFIKEYGHIDTTLNFVKISTSPEVSSLFEKYSSKAWLLGKSPEFDLKLENRFPWGELEIGLNIKNGAVRDCSVYSDSMDVDFIKALKRSLQNIEFSKEKIVRSISRLPETVERDDLLDWICSVDM